jgi:hypothetical protein
MVAAVKRILNVMYGKPWDVQKGIYKDKKRCFLKLKESVV